MFGVYFDYKDAGTDIVLGVIVHDGSSTVLRDSKKVPKVEGQTNYEFSLEAWKWATDVVLNEDFDEVTFCNQNKLIFDWAISGRYTKARAHYYESIIGNIQQMIDAGYEANFEVVKGEKNLAKKYLKKFHVAPARGSFNNLFSQAKQVQPRTKKAAPKKTRAAKTSTKTATRDNAISADRQSVVPFKRKQA